MKYFFVVIVYYRSRVSIGPSLREKCESSYVRAALPKSQKYGALYDISFSFSGNVQNLVLLIMNRRGSVPIHTSFNLFINSPLSNNIVHSLGLKTNSKTVTRSARCNHIETEGKFLFKVNDIN